MFEGEKGGRAKKRLGDLGRWVGLIETGFFFGLSVLFVLEVVK